jgi:hypothetical protein
MFSVKTIFCITFSLKILVVMSKRWFFAPDKVVAQLEDDGALVAHVGDLTSFKLNQIGFDVLQLLYEPQTLGSLVKQICQAYEVEGGECARLLLPFLHELESTGWIVALAQDLNETPLSSRYLDLLKRALVNWIYPEHELQVSYLQSDRVVKDPLTRSRYLRDIAQNEAEKFTELLEKKRHGFVTVLSHTLVGLRRLNHLEYCARKIFAEGIHGDFFEAGVCQGGASIFLRALQVVRLLCLKTRGWILPSRTIPGWHSARRGSRRTSGAMIFGVIRCAW